MYFCPAFVVKYISYVVSLKAVSSKGTCQENFTTVCGCFGPGFARVNPLGELKKEEEGENEE